MNFMLENFKNRLNKKLKRLSDTKDLYEKDLEKMLSMGATIVDVRSPQEYREGHLEKAILMPEYELLSKHRKLFKNKDEIIIVYCSNGTRSKRAKRKLEKLGYTNVYSLNVVI